MGMLGFVSQSDSKTDKGRYIEGIVRGYRNTLLTHQSYGNLTQCETIDGILESSITLYFVDRT